MLTFKQYLQEGAEEHEKFKDHTKNPYHKLLTQHGWQHQKTEHAKNPFAKDNPRADSTTHTYTHPQHEGSTVKIEQEHDTGVGHGGRAAKESTFSHRHKQSNGIIAPSHGDTKPQLHRSLSYHYGVNETALSEAPKVASPAHVNLHNELRQAGFTATKHRKSDGHSIYDHPAKGRIEVSPNGYWDHVPKTGQKDAKSGFWPNSKPRV